MSGADTGDAAAGFITAARVAPSGAGPLTGWDVAVKDNIDVAGLQTTGGTAILRGHTAAADAEVVRRMRSAGATVVGKTLLHELGHGITGVNPTFGTTVHPADPSRTVGGSSGGSALAVLTGKARVALGTDTGGSARIPAAFTGIVGFRPTLGRYDADGVLRISPSRDTVGVLARDVADVATVDAVLAGEEPRGNAPTEHTQHPTRIGVPSEARAGLSAALLSVFDASLASLAAAGYEIVEITAPRSLDAMFEHGLTVLQAETIAAISEYLATVETNPSVAELVERSESPDVRAILSAALTAPEPEGGYRSALAAIDELGAAYRAQLAQLDVAALAYPTAAVEPPKLRAESGDDAAAELRGTVLLSTPATLVGTPAISLPAGHSPETGLPVGLTLEHPDRGGDRELLALAARAAATLAAAAKDRVVS